MIYGYARVSTKLQATDGNSLEAQVNQLKENGAVEIYQEAFTGTKSDRPEFTELLEKLQKGDTLIVTKLDRFARSMTQGSQLVNELIERGVKVHILNIGMMDNTPASKLIRGIFFSFAEFERDMIVERTTEGRNIAKANGAKMGRTKRDDSQLKHAIELYKEGAMSVVKIAEATGVGRATIFRRVKELKAEGLL